MWNDASKIPFPSDGSDFLLCWNGAIGIGSYEKEDDTVYLNNDPIMDVSSHISEERFPEGTYWMEIPELPGEDCKS